MKKHHPPKECDVALDEEERELFLNAFYQNITPTQHSAKPSPSSAASLNKAEQLIESDKELFLRAVNDADFFSFNLTQHNRINEKSTPRKKRNSIDAKLDLHGLFAEEAVERLLHFIEHEKNRGSRLILVVHGKGAGVLKKAVLAIVEQHPFVDDFQGAPGRYGGQGAILLRLNRKYK